MVLGYIIGSIPSGYLLARWHGVDDIRNYGSGNIGATNVARILGIKYFFIVFCLDFFKAYLFLKLLIYFNCNDLLLCLAAGVLLIGNAASIFLNFHGGKGMATGFGISLALYPSLLLIAFFVWLLAFSMVRVVGIASIITLITLPFITWYYSFSFYFVLLIYFKAAFGLYKHRNNLLAYLVR
jgi:glycerol-3-phosphate acyltransferase PlsY